jgi:hypothetical protein
MDEPRRPDAATWRPSRGLIAVALALVAGALAAWGAWPDAPRTLAEAPATASAPAAASGPPTVVATASARAPAAPPRAAAAPAAREPASTPHVQRRRSPRGDQTPDLADYINDGDIPTTAEVIDRLHAAGVHGGLGAFSPPGTRPPLVGLAVPEDFALPEGYVRHYQATDDGQRIEPILMFAPDHEFFDADYRPIEIPKDRVVPPELAPPGLPIRRIVVPAPIDASRAGG